MAKMNFKQLLGMMAVAMLISCECPYLEEKEDQGYQPHTKSDAFYAEKLLGTWQCYYPMIIGGVEFKEIKFLSNGKADITMAKQRDTDWYTETYDYAYYGNTLRFSRKGNNISLHIDGYLFPELYLSDSFGSYTIAKRKSEGCISLQGFYYEGNDVSAVRGINANSREYNGEVEEVARYNLSGHPCKPYDKGVQIVVYSDYTTKTIIIE